MRKRLVLAAALSVLAVTVAEARPARWCGWYARHNLVSVDPGKDYDQACKWRSYGRPAFGPSIGALVVWCSSRHHHVGKITAGPDAQGQWEVLSGNDGRSVRKRYRSVAGASFRSI